MEDGTLTVPVIHAGTNFLCAGRNMKRYTKEEIEQNAPIVSYGKGLGRDLLKTDIEQIRLKQIPNKY